MELAEYDELAKVAGVGRDVLEKRIRTLVDRGKELEVENAYLRSTTPGPTGAPSPEPARGMNGPTGPSHA